MSNDAQDEEGLEGLVDAIAGQIDKGYGMVPFAGAGFSVPSGSPIITELQDYLQRCICVSLQIDQDGEANPDEFQPWNPRTDQWPPLIDKAAPTGKWERALFRKVFCDGDVAKDIRKQLSEVLDSLPESLVSADDHPTAEWGNRLTILLNELKSSHLAARPEPSDEIGRRRYWRWDTLYGEALGAMKDWRTALQFLSRLEIPARKAKPNNEPPALGSPQAEVIDAFWREVLKGRHPTLGHRMLGALAGALRIDLVLTTNFDDLIERAFEAARNPLQVFEVMLEGSLPQRTDVESHRTLVKMHGGRISLRADYSLDEPPTAADVDRFVSYLMSNEGRAKFAKNQVEALKNPSIAHSGQKYKSEKHLLVFGFSGADRRIVQFVRESIDRLDNDFRVYWIGFGPKDDPRDQLADLRGKDGLVYHRCTNLGFFFLELYQRLRNDLPPLGSVFPSASRLTLPPTPSGLPHEEVDWETRKDKFSALLASAVSPAAPKQPKPVILALADENTDGLTTLCANHFRTLETNPKVAEIWVDMNNVSSTENLFEVLLEAVHYRIGTEEWTPATSKRAADEITPFKTPAVELTRLLESVNKRWVVFLNARETPGANTYEKLVGGRNGWLENRKSPVNGVAQDEPSGLEDTANVDDFAEMLKTFTSEAKRLTFVVMATSDDVFLGNDVWPESHVERVPLASTPEVRDTFLARVLTACDVWMKANPEEKSLRERFLHALVRAQRPRFPASLWTCAFFEDKDVGVPVNVRRDSIRRYLEELTATGLVRRKPGGMVWVHSDCRRELRKQFDERESFSGEIHVDLAAWYEKVVDDSESPDAVFESAYHFCKAADAFAVRKKPKHTDGNSTSDLERAASLLDAATAQIRSEGFLIQTHGYSRGSCRQLSRLGEIGERVLENARTPPRKKINPARV